MIIIDPNCFTGQPFWVGQSVDPSSHWPPIQVDRECQELIFKGGKLQLPRKLGIWEILRSTFGQVYKCFRFSAQQTQVSRSLFWGV